MGAAYTANEIIELTGGRLALGLLPSESGGICSDSRYLKEGEWFLALKGESFDGHDFIGDAFAAGALGCIAEERGNYSIASTSFPIIAVNDTDEAHFDLTQCWRRTVNPKVILFAGNSFDVGHLMALCAQTIANQQMPCYVIAGKADPEKNDAEIIDAGEDSAEKAIGGELSEGKTSQNYVLSKFLDMPACTQVVLLAVFPPKLSDVCPIEEIADADVLVLTKEAFDNFRLSNSLEEITHAKRHLLNSDKVPIFTIINLDHDPALLSMQDREAERCQFLLPPDKNKNSLAKWHSPKSENLNFMPDSHPDPVHAESRQLEYAWVAKQVVALLREGTGD